MQWIDTCLKSIVNSSTKLDIIVIDNNSSDGTVSYIKKQYPEIILFEQKTNLGFGKANNLGMPHALNNNCDYVFLLNQDAYLEVDSIGKMIGVHKESPEYGILSPIHLNGKGDKLDKNFSNYLRYDSNNYFYHDALKHQLKSVYSVPFVNAAAWLLPKNTLKVIGGFDPIFFHYGEDDNYCQRALYHNLKIGVVPNAYIKHDREGVLKRPIDTEAKKLSNFETQIKVNYADLMRAHDKLNSLIKYKKKHFIKLVIKLKVKKASFIYKEYSILKTSKVQILKSKELNIKQAPNYLNF